MPWERQDRRYDDVGEDLVRMCAQCGTPHLKSWGSWCCKECQLDAADAVEVGRQERMVPRPCAVGCGGMIPAGSAGKYCSPRCKHVAYRDRKARIRYGLPPVNGAA